MQDKWRRLWRGSERTWGEEDEVGKGGAEACNKDPRFLHDADLLVGAGRIVQPHEDGLEPRLGCHALKRRHHVVLCGKTTACCFREGPKVHCRTWLPLSCFGSKPPSFRPQAMPDREKRSKGRREGHYESCG